MATKFVPVTSLEEAEQAYAAGLLFLDNFSEQSGQHRTEFVRIDTDPGLLRDCWRERFGKEWPMSDFGVFVEEEDGSEVV